MLINLEVLRSVLRPYAVGSVRLSDMLEKLWPMMLSADEDSKELVESIQDILALHAARSIDDVALRQRLVAVAFAPGSLAEGTVSIVQNTATPSGGVLKPTPTYFITLS